jgi:hypothetical protein
MLRAETSYAIALVCALAAWIDLTPVFHWGHNSDSVLPLVIARDHWTPFFWGQNRFGMFLALAVSPIHDAWTMFFAYHWLLISLSLVPGFALARGLGASAAFGAAITAAALLLVPDQVFWVYVTNPYGASFGFFFAGLLSCELPGRGGRAVAGALFLLSFWLNSGLLALVAPALVLRAALLPGSVRQRIKGTVRSGLPLAYGLVAALALSRLGPHVITYHFLKPFELAGSWRAFLVQAAKPWGLTPFAAVSAVALVGAGALALRAFARDDGARAAAAASAGLVFGGIASFLVFGALDWVKQNEYAFRYAAPSYVAVLLGAAALLAPISTRIRALPAAAALVVATAVHYGAPSIRTSSAAVEKSIGELTSDVVAADCGVLIGDYWKVWPAVFHLRASRPDRTLYGIAIRAEDDSALIRRAVAAGRRLCSPADDPEVPRLAREWGLGPLVPLTRVGRVDVLSGAAP